MKRTIGIALLVGGLFVPRLAPGQGTLYYSNLGEITAGGMAVGSDNWLAHGFKTGTNSGGYSLNGIQLLMGASTGNPGGFSVALYSHSPGGVTPPGSFLGSLSGPDPAAGGTFTYNSDGLLLDPATWYFVVVTGSTPIGTGAYSWSGTDSYNAAVSDGWLRAGFDQYSRTGLVWGRIVGPLFQLGISATAVPEPATLSLVGLGLVVLGFWRCKRK